MIASSKLNDICVSFALPRYYYTKWSISFGILCVGPLKRQQQKRANCWIYRNREIRAIGTVLKQKAAHLMVTNESVSLSHFSSRYTWAVHTNTHTHLPKKQPSFTKYLCAPCWLFLKFKVLTITIIMKQPESKQINDPWTKWRKAPKRISQKNGRKRARAHTDGE